jgi:integration host factor subunit beta
VTKSELMQALSSKFLELEKRDVELAVNCMLRQMTDSLVQGERIEIRGFCGFSLHHRTSHLARNPKTGEAVNLSAKVAVHFNPGKEIRDRVNAGHNKCRITD